MSDVSRIGTAKEKSLHAALKVRYAGEAGTTEAQVGSYVCDAVREDGEIVEIQTGNFGSIEDKLSALVQGARVRLVHPIAALRFVEVRDPDGTLLRRRKSPRGGTEWDIFAALIRAPRLPLMAGLSIELALVEETELRVADGKGSWRRKGVSVLDRRLDAVRDTILLSGAEDYRRYLPDALGSEFTSKELAAAGPIRTELARKALYVLCRIGLIAESGKRGRTKLYKRTKP